MSNKLLITIILLAAILFGLGFAVGYFFKAQKTASQIEKMEKVLKPLELGRIISSIPLFGQVANISGRIITLSQGDDNMTIKIGDNAQIYSLVSSSADGKTTREQKKAEFSEIKIGDRLNAGVKLTPGGDFEAVSVIIIPTAGEK